jgi:hypothetical protein
MDCRANFTRPNFVRNRVFYEAHLTQQQKSFRVLEIDDLADRVRRQFAVAPSQNEPLTGGRTEFELRAERDNREAG